MRGRFLHPYLLHQLLSTFPFLLVCFPNASGAHLELLDVSLSLFPVFFQILYHDTLFPELSISTLHLVLIIHKEPASQTCRGYQSHGYLKGTGDDTDTAMTIHKRDQHG